MSSRPLRWALSLTAAAAIGFYLFRHWELAAAPLAELLEAFIR